MHLILFFVQKYGDCAYTSATVFNYTTTFSNTPGTTALTLTGVNNLGVFAGRTIVRQANGANKECTVVLQTAYQPNINDTYVPATTATTSTTQKTEPTGFACAWVISAFLVCLLVLL
jgi:hypothetical protein